MDVKEYSVTKLRRQLLENGYTPLANRDKACYLERWPTIAVNENVINRWSRMRRYTGTGLRVENGLCVIDIDIDHPVIEDVIDAMLAVLPESTKPERLERAGKGHKIAWFCRCDELFTRLHTRRWVETGADADASTFCVEIFGGSSPRQFGAFGPHTITDENEVKVTYQWVDESPATTPFNALDILTKKQLHAMIDAAEAELKLRGFEPVALSSKGESAPGRIYDLTEDMMFDLADGDTVGLDTLEKMVRDGYVGRCSASFLEGATAANTSRCIISKTGGGSVSIWESAAGETHLPARIKPKDRNSRIDRVQEAINKEVSISKNKLSYDDDAETCAAKLLETYAFLPNAKNPFIPLNAVALSEGVSMQNFRTMHNPWKTVEIGPKGGEKVLHPVNLFVDNFKRKLIRGVHMRPDMPTPLYEDGGDMFVNTYRPPALGSGEDGRADVGERFMEQLVPDKREREWFLKWLAYKWKYPHVPGPALIMVAREMGTGRGTFKSLLEKLFGERYVANVPFKNLAGSGSQAQYTDWAANALFAVVNESSNGREVSAYKAKHDLYEHLKELVEPRQTRVRYILKGVPSFEAMSSTTFIFNTNHVDAIPLPSGDRRFAVLTNGEPRDEEFWVELNTWIDERENIAAFADWLETIDISDYNPYAMPLHTSGKRDMTEFNKSGFDLTVTRLIVDYSVAGDYFTLNHVIDAVRELIYAGKVDEIRNWQDVVKSIVRSNAYAVKNESGDYVRPKIKGEKVMVWTTRKSASTCIEKTGWLRKKVIQTGDVFGISKERQAKLDAAEGGDIDTEIDGKVVDFRRPLE